MGGNGATSWGQALKRRWPWRRRAHAFAAGALGSPSEMPGVQIGGYPLVRTFAHGALGELHLASDPDTGAPIAIKTVRLHGGELTRERFVRESHAAAKLRHPSIVQCHATGVVGQGEEAIGWIAMEWVAGSDLARYTSAARLLPEPLVLELTAQAAEALAHAHRHGVVHRDIKPANLLFDPLRGSLKIADFGCAHLTDAERSRSGVLAGTPVYMAPEQLAGAPVDGRCDLYALGVVLFELLTGRLPLEAGSMGELLRAITSEPPPSLQRLRPDLPPALDELLSRLLAKAPGERPADGVGLARELRHVAAALVPTLVSPGGPPSAAAGTMSMPLRPTPPTSP